MASGFITVSERKREGAPDKAKVFFFFLAVLCLCCGPCGVGASLVVDHRLSFPPACGILVPLLRIEPESPALEGRILTTGPSGTSHHSHL